MGKPWVCLLSHRFVDELRLTTLAVGKDHQVPYDVIGYYRSKILTNDVQAKVDSGCSAGRSEDVFVVYVQDIGHDLDLWIELAQLVAELPMSCSLSAIQKASGCQHKCSATDGYQADSSLVSQPQPADKWRWR